MSDFYLPCSCGCSILRFEKDPYIDDATLVWVYQSPAPRPSMRQRLRTAYRAAVGKSLVCGDLALGDREIQELKEYLHTL